jgi:FtsZ-interacting cell division protein YlmF
MMLLTVWFGLFAVTALNEIIKHRTQKRKQKQNTSTNPQHQTPRWATFTYSEKETRNITKIFKDTKIKIAFRTQNTVQNIVKQHPQKTCNDSRIYQMKCLDFPLNT